MVDVYPPVAVVLIILTTLPLTEMVTTPTLIAEPDPPEAPKVQRTRNGYQLILQRYLISRISGRSNLNNLPNILLIRCKGNSLYARRSCNISINTSRNRSRKPE